MHRQILNAPEGMFGDHINHNRLDNRRANLRLATKTQNAANQTVSKRPKSSQFKGVSWSNTYGRWRVATSCHGHRIFIGYFQDEVEAARAYDRTARQLFGEFAYCNFGDEA